MINHPISQFLRKIGRASWIVFACLVAGSAGGYVAGNHLGFSEAADRTRRLPSGAIPCKPGPWGELTYTSFTIAAPDDLIPLRSIERRGTHWFLADFTADTFVSFLQGTSLTPEQQQQYLAPAVFHPRPDGIELTPSPDMVFSLPADARDKIYQSLAQSDENDSDINYLAEDAVPGQFANSGVSPATMAMFHRLCSRRGDDIMFSGVAALLSRIPTYDEKLHFAKALTRQRTMVLNLHITPATDVDTLAQYWDRGSWGTDVHTILRSLTAIPTGTWMNILMVLPSLPASEIYTYPNIVDNPLDGPPVNRDCAWTSLNFFRDIPDPNFGKPDFVRRELFENYSPLNGSPRYGDLVLVGRPDGKIFHIAIYMADDIWFTKNGGSLVHPWMLSTASDVLKQFEFAVKPGEHLAVSYYRNTRL